MKAASNLIMWLAMVLLVSLAMVLGLVLLLLAELYCSPIIRRHRRHFQPTTTTTTTTGNNSGGHAQSQTRSNASRSPLDTNDDIEKQHHDRSPENQDSSYQVKAEIGKRCSGDHSVNGCPFVYISNPIYENENGRGSTVADDDDNDKTPFETPGTSPSRLETEDSFGDEEISSSKKLAAVDRKDGGRLVGSCGSDTNSISNNGVYYSSSSLSTPCTSPSL